VIVQTDDPLRRHAWVWLLWAGVGSVLLLEFHVNARMPWAVFRDNQTYMIAAPLSRALLWAIFTPMVFSLGRRFPFSAGWLRWLCFHLVFATLVMVMINIARAWILTALVAPDASWRAYMPGAIFANWTARWLIDWEIYWLVLGVGWFNRVRRERTEAQLHEAALATKLAEAELRALRQQVQPHFLFNALNAVASLVRTGKKDEAVHTLSQLSALHRTLLEGNRNAVTSLAAEFTFLERYLDVERIRCGERLQVKIDLPADCRGAVVPTLLLQPLVENAIKHGVARRTGGARVGVFAQRCDNRVIVSVTNDPPDPDNVTPSNESTGFGLRHTTERLRQFFEGDARLEFAPTTHGVVAVRLDMPFMQFSNPDQR
jgi:LytS/YehU family sensor histidine kinase